MSRCSEKKCREPSLALFASDGLDGKPDTLEKKSWKSLVPFPTMPNPGAAGGDSFEDVHSPSSSCQHLESYRLSGLKSRGFEASQRAWGQDLT